MGRPGSPTRWPILWPGTGTRPRSSARPGSGSSGAASMRRRSAVLAAPFRSRQPDPGWLAPNCPHRRGRLLPRRRLLRPALFLRQLPSAARYRGAAAPAAGRALAHASFHGCGRGRRSHRRGGRSAGRHRSVCARRHRHSDSLIARAHMRYCSRDRGAELVVVRDESVDELVQAGLEYLLDRGCSAAACGPCGRGAAPAPAGHRRARCGPDFARYSRSSSRATRHLVVEDQQVGDQPGLEAFAIDPVIGGERRDRAQDRGPLEIVERAADAARGPAAAGDI